MQRELPVAELATHAKAVESKSSGDRTKRATRILLNLQTPLESR